MGRICSPGIARILSKSHVGKSMPIIFASLDLGTSLVMSFGVANKFQPKQSKPFHREPFSVIPGPPFRPRRLPLHPDELQAAVLHRLRHAPRRRLPRHLLLRLRLSHPLPPLRPREPRRQNEEELPLAHHRHGRHRRFGRFLLNSSRYTFVT